jgi:hypothetical protein
MIRYVYPGSGIFGILNIRSWGQKTLDPESGTATLLDWIGSEGDGRVAYRYLPNFKILIPGTLLTGSFTCMQDKV